MDAKAAGFKYSEARVSLVLAPSARAAACIVLACLATAGLIAATPLSLVVRVPALAWTAFAAIRALRRIAWHRGKQGVRGLRIDGGALIEVDDGEGRVIAGEVRSGSFVAPWLTIVRWQPEGSRLRRSIVLLPDMVEAESFRALRVVLRWTPAPR